MFINLQCVMCLEEAPISYISFFGLQSVFHFASHVDVKIVT
jgi:hypothetical protein